jgi:nucleotide-binding universal stress UspA family protein
MKILLAVDSSEYSKTAAENVSKRPWPPETVVRVLSAVQDFVPPASELWYDAGGSLEEANLHVIKQAEQLTDKIGEAVRASGLTVETTVRRGDPRSVILDEAKDWDADLIVVGSHGYTGIKRLLLGSVAQSVVSQAPCSVEVVRQKSENKETSP